MCVSVSITPGTFEMPPAMTSAISSYSPDPDHRDQVDVAGDGVDLADPGEVGDVLGHLGDRVGRAVDEDDRGDHLRCSFQHVDIVMLIRRDGQLPPDPDRVAQRLARPTSAPGHTTPRVTCPATTAPARR